MSLYNLNYILQENIVFGVISDILDFCQRLPSLIYEYTASGGGKSVKLQFCWLSERCASQSGQKIRYVLRFRDTLRTSKLKSLLQSLLIKRVHISMANNFSVR